MKTHSIFYAVLAVACVNWANTSTGQTNSPPGGTPPAQANEPKENLKIESGTVYERLPNSVWKLVGEGHLSDAVDALVDLYPAITISIDPSLRTVELPDIKIRASDVPADLEALRVASGSMFIVGNRYPSVYTLEPSALFLQRTAQGQALSVVAFNLTGYLGTLKDTSEQGVRKTMSAIADLIKEAASGPEAGKPSDVRFSFYPDANLLVVRGPAMWLNAAHSIISALPEKSPADPQFHPAARNIQNSTSPELRSAPSPLFPRRPGTTPPPGLGAGDLIDRPDAPAIPVPPPAQELPAQPNQ